HVSPRTPLAAWPPKRRTLPRAASKTIACPARASGCWQGAVAQRSDQTAPSHSNVSARSEPPDDPPKRTRPPRAVSYARAWLDRAEGPEPRFSQRTRDAVTSRIEGGPIVMGALDVAGAGLRSVRQAAALRSKPAAVSAAKRSERSMSASRL